MRDCRTLRAWALALALPLAVSAMAQEPPAGPPPAAPDRAEQLERIDAAIEAQVDRRRLGGMSIALGGLIAIGGAYYDAGKFGESGWAALGGALGLACALGGASTMHDAGMQLHELRQQRLQLAASPARPALILTFRFGAP